MRSLPYSCEVSPLPTLPRLVLLMTIALCSEGFRAGVIIRVTDAANPGFEA